jgi:hypothetical protein
MPRQAFPLSKTHTFSLGSGWRWRVISLEAGGRRFRLLVAYEASKDQYRAWLGLEVGTDQALLARLEYHPSHRGWHCHLKKGLLTDIGCGVVKHPGEREHAKSCNSSDSLRVGDTDALAIAYRAFNVETEAGELFQ